MLFLLLKPAKEPMPLAEYFSHHGISSFDTRSSFGLCRKELIFSVNDYNAKRQIKNKINDNI